MTRAARLVLAGDLVAATHMHPLWPIVLPLGALAFSAEVLAYVRTGRWGAVLEGRPFRYVALLTFVALVVVWLARFAGAFGGRAIV
jgi:hypothetical protein